MRTREPHLERQTVEILAAAMMTDTARAVAHAMTNAGMREGQGWEMVSSSGNERGVFRLYFERWVTPRQRTRLNARASRRPLPKLQPRVQVAKRAWG